MFGLFYICNEIKANFLKLKLLFMPKMTAYTSVSTYNWLNSVIDIPYSSSLVKLSTLLKPRFCNSVFTPWVANEMILEFLF